MALTQTPEEGLKVSNAPSDGKFLQYKDSTDKLTWATAGAGSMSNLVEDTTPQLGGNLDVQDKVITTNTGTNTDITIKPKGSGDLQVGPGDAEGTISANGGYNLRIKAEASGDAGANINLGLGTNGSVELTPLGTGQVHVVQGKFKVGGNGSEAHVTTHNTSHLLLNTNEGSNSGEIEIEDGADNDIKITPNGTGDGIIDGLKYPQADGSAGQFLKTDGSAQLSWATISSTPEGEAVLSTTNSNETSGKVLTADGDGTCSWQSVPASGAALTGSTNNTITTVTGANAIQGEANLTFDGNTLHTKSGDSGQSTPVVWGDDLVVEGSGDSGMTILSGNTSDGSVIFGDDGDADVARIAYNHSSNYMSFDTNGDNRLRITSDGKIAGGSGLPASPSDNLHFRASSGTNYARFTTHHSGNDKSVKFGVNSSGDAIVSGLNDTSMYLGTNNTSRVKIMNDGSLIRLHALEVSTNAGLMEFKKVANEGTPGIRWCRNGAYSGYGSACEFVHNATTVGTIKYATGSTQYNTSSDYRLKENIINLTGAIDRVKQLVPKRFNFKIDSSVTVDGFLAHEVDSIVPEAVDGTKDEIVTQAGKDSGRYGSDATVGDPVYQGIDQSKIVPLLTAALQEAIAKIETLETKVAALEAA